MGFDGTWSLDGVNGTIDFETLAALSRTAWRGQPFYGLARQRRVKMPFN
jgi:hypothetical protein